MFWRLILVLLIGNDHFPLNQNLEFTSLSLVFSKLTIIGIKIISRHHVSMQSLSSLTCQRRKSLSRTSPDVRMSRSGLGDLLLYKHSLSSGSETSLSTTEQHKRSVLEQKISRLHHGCGQKISRSTQDCHLALIKPCSTPHAISLTALVISYLDV